MKKNGLTVILILLCFVISNISKAADDCRLYTRSEYISGRYYVKIRKDCDKAVTVQYKVVFADGTEDVNGMEYMSSSVREVTGRSYTRDFQIIITNANWEGIGVVEPEEGGKVQEGKSGGSSGGGHNNPFDDSFSELGAAIIIGAVTIGVVALSNEFYVLKTESTGYNGYALGLKNSMSRHIDLEYGASVFNKGEGLLKIKGLDSEYYTTFDDPVWALDIAALYNIFPRYNHDGTFLNPYFGFCVTKDFGELSRGAFGGIVGISAGRQLKFHIRYKMMRNFDYDVKLVNHVEFGLSIRFQKGVFFR